MVQKRLYTDSLGVRLFSHDKIVVPFSIGPLQVRHLVPPFRKHSSMAYAPYGNRDMR